MQCRRASPFCFNFCWEQLCEAQSTSWPGSPGGGECCGGLGGCRPGREEEDRDPLARQCAPWGQSRRRRGACRSAEMVSSPCLFRWSLRKPWKRPLQHEWDPFFVSRAFILCRRKAELFSRMRKGEAFVCGTCLSWTLRGSSLLEKVNFSWKKMKVRNFVFQGFYLTLTSPLIVNYHQSLTQNNNEENFYYLECFLTKCLCSQFSSQFKNHLIASVLYLSSKYLYTLSTSKEASYNILTFGASCSF